MNWSDLLVLGIIVGFGIIGLTRGFILSIFRLASFLVSIIASIKLYPVVAKFLMKTALYTNIKQSIFKSLMHQQQVQSSGVNDQLKEAGAKAVVDNLHVPGFLKDMIEKDMVKSLLPNPTSLIDMSRVMDFISDKLATITIEIISLVLLYIAIRIALTFARVILQGIAKLPLFRQVDKLGGFALGAVEGLLTVYVLFAIVMLFNAAPQFQGLFEAMDTSIVAKFIYQNNFIVDWMFPG
ncbi:MAG: CvpA family protein [Clostridia bacterium]|nr:CvpA family protein [Clostridia bacterium]